jgi:hypothetical protein
MIIVWEHDQIGYHVVHHVRKPLEKGIGGLAGEMREVLVLSPVSRVYLILNLGIPTTSILQMLRNPIS